jgi:hypothetical protein
LGEPKQKVRSRGTQNSAVNVGAPPPPRARTIEEEKTKTIVQRQASMKNLEGKILTPLLIAHLLFFGL